LKGQYSKEFLDKLPESRRAYFTLEKELIEFKDEKGNAILRQAQIKGRKAPKAEKPRKPAMRKPPMACMTS